MTQLTFVPSTDTLFGAWTPFRPRTPSSINNFDQLDWLRLSKDILHRKLTPQGGLIKVIEIKDNIFPGALVIIALIV